LGWTVEAKNRHNCCGKVLQVFLRDLQFGRVGQKPVLLPDLGWTVKSKVILIAEFQFTRQELFPDKKKTEEFTFSSIKKLKLSSVLSVAFIFSFQI
jgi:hypothetical protein